MIAKIIPKINKLKTVSYDYIINFERYIKRINYLTLWQLQYSRRNHLHF